MCKKTGLLFCLLLFGYIRLSCQDSSNVFLLAFDKIEKGDTSYFLRISHSKDAGTNYAYYLCKAKLFGSNSHRTSAFELYKKAIEMSRTNKEKAIANIKMGVYFTNNDILIPALQYFNKAELLYSFTDNDQGYVELNKYIGLINSYIGSKQKSNERFLRLYQLARKRNDKKLMANAANNTGINYIDLHQFDEAEKFLGISLALRIENNDKFLMGQCYNNFGTLYYEKGEYDKAIQYYNKGYLLRKNFGTSLSSITESEINMGKTYFKLGNMSAAEQMLQNAFAKGKQENHIKFISQATEYLKDIYYTKKEYKKAYDMQAEYQSAMDSLYGYEKRDQVNRLSIENEFKGKIISDSLSLIKKESELKVKETRNARNKVVLLSLGIVLLLVLFIGINLFRQNKREISKNLLISSQANELKEKHKEMKDSINYAKNLQHSLLPSNEVLDSFLKDYFILYLPKDVVSGDFYWAASVTGPGMGVGETPGASFELFHLTLADCTGHGVPGAIVSIVGITALTRCINEFHLSEPGAILDKLSELVAESFSHNNRQLNDGMDISFCTISRTNGVYSLKWSGANNPLWIIRNNQLMEFKGTRRPVGAFVNTLAFKEESIDLQKDDLIYMVTDGFGDQFGGEKGKKYKQGNLKELLLSFHTLPLHEQEKKLHETFLFWKSKHEQVDDVSVIGFRL